MNAKEEIVGTRDAKDDEKDVRDGDDDQDRDHQIWTIDRDDTAREKYRKFYDAIRVNPLVWMEDDGKTYKDLDEDEQYIVDLEKACTNAISEGDRAIKDGDLQKAYKNLYDKINRENLKKTRRMVAIGSMMNQDKDFLFTDVKRTRDDDDGSNQQLLEDTEQRRPEIINADAAGRTPATIEQIIANVHCHQCLPQATECMKIPVKDARYEQWLKESGDRTSMHRFSFTDIPYTRFLHMGGVGVHPRKDYVEDELKPSVMHWGQLKLLMGEIDFLAEYMGECLLKRKKCRIIYAGATPGHHLPVLIKLFPGDWEWDLIDVLFSRGTDTWNKFLAKKEKTRGLRIGYCWQSEVFTSDQNEGNFHQTDLKPPGLPDPYHPGKTGLGGRTGHVIQRYNAADCRKCLESEMTASLDDITRTRMNTFIELTTRCDVDGATNATEYDLQKWNGVKCHYYDNGMAEQHAPLFEQSPADELKLFISDIRNRYKSDSEGTIQNDMYTQKKLYIALKPYQAMLKFKLPWTPPFGPSTIHPKGKIKYQIYSRPISHETRLITDKIEDWSNEPASYETKYNHKEYEKKLFFFTSVLRTSLYTGHVLKATEESHPVLFANQVAVCDCYDCYTTREIMHKFVRELERAKQLKEHLKDLGDSPTPQQLVNAKELADLGVKEMDKEQLEQKALDLLETLVTELAFLQAKCGGYDFDLDTGAR
jgi:hypothetical protein